MKKELYILIGPKGAGKTYIGMLVASNTSIRFLQVEKVWLELNEGEDGWKRVAEEIDREFRESDRVMIESLGAGDGYRWLSQHREEKYIVRLIRVIADLDLCLTRVQQRDQADQIEHSLERVAEFNAIASRILYDWDLEIENEGKISDAQIVDAIRGMAEPESNPES